MIRFLARTSLTFVALTLVLLLEACAFGVYERRFIAGPWEFGAVLIYAVPIAASFAAPVAVMASALSIKAARAHVLPAALAIAIAACTYFTLGGRRVIAYRTVATGVALVASFFGLAIALRRIDNRSRAPLGVQGAAGGGLIAACWALDRFVLPRLYEGLHALWLLGTIVGAALLTGSVWGLIEQRSAKPIEQARWPIAGALLLMACALWAPRASKELLRFDNVRLLLADNAPLLGRAVRGAALLGHAPPPAEAHDENDAPSTTSGVRALDWTNRDIVLITIDALRADHVGSYGYGRKTTPELDALAKESARFTHAYCPTPHTSYSVTSLMTGKYMRPLLLLGLGGDSETFASFLRKYDYRTAAFYPPAVFFIDEERFQGFRDRNLDFEYAKVEFAKPALRLAQIDEYLATASKDRPLFLWLHLFEPHEPYEKHADHDFGDTDIDRYDGEIAEADALAGAVIRKVRALKKDPVVIVTADHGEEFGDHGGRYHGTTVYEEQVRVPLLIHGAGVPPGIVSTPVQTIDILPTTLSALAVPVPPRLRGRDLGRVLTGQASSVPPPPNVGFAFAETDRYTMIAQGADRLVCERQLGACALYDVATDPRQTNRSTISGPRFDTLRSLQKSTELAHGKFEGERGVQIPEALRRGASGDRDAARDVAALLDDAKADIRLQAARVLFKLRATDVLPNLERALTTEDRPENRRELVLALARTKLEVSPDLPLILTEGTESQKQRAGWVLAELKDARGEDALVALFRDRKALEFEEQREVTGALAKIRSKKAMPLLLEALGDVRLRPYVALALGQLGDARAKEPLLTAFSTEPYVNARYYEAFALGKSRPLGLDVGRDLVPLLSKWAGAPELFPALDTFLLDLGLLKPGAPQLPVRAPVRLFVAAKTRNPEAVVELTGGPRGMRVPAIDPRIEADLWEALRRGGEATRAPNATPDTDAGVASTGDGPSVTWYFDLLEAPNSSIRPALRDGEGSIVGTWAVPLTVRP